MKDWLISLLFQNQLISDEDREIYSYAIFVSLFNSLCILTIFIIGAFFNQFNFTVIFTLFYIPNRILSGGYHCKTPQYCYFTFSSIYIIIMFLYSNDFVIGNMFLMTLVIYSIYLKNVLNKNNLTKYNVILVMLFVFYVLLAMQFSNFRAPLAYSILLNYILFILGEKFNIKKIDR